MRPENVPAELVEKAARHRFERHFVKYPEITWESTFEDIRAKYRASAADYLGAVLPDIQAQALRDEAAAVDREVNERCAAELVADTRCDDCGLRYGERDQYGCQGSGRGHTYDQEELDGRAEPLDATTFYGNQLRQKAARLTATTEEPADA